MQAALTEILQRRYDLPDPPQVINGDVPGGKRLARAEEFEQQPGFGVLILSPRAGGVGLTITGANHVIHLGRWWNPAIEDQATDRVYRIGQDKPVHVYTPSGASEIRRRELRHASGSASVPEALAQPRDSWRHQKPASATSRTCSKTSWARRLHILTRCLCP